MSYHGYPNNPYDQNRQHPANVGVAPGVQPGSIGVNGTQPSTRPPYFQTHQMSNFGGSVTKTCPMMNIGASLTGIAPPTAIGPNPNITAPPMALSQSNRPPLAMSMGAPPTIMAPSSTNMGFPPTAIGVSQKPMAPSTSSMASHQNSMAPSLNSMVHPPTNMEAHPTYIGGPPTSMSAPLSSMSAPLTSIGAPPTSIGAPRTLISAPPRFISAPTSNLGHSTTSMGPRTNMYNRPPMMPPNGPFTPRASSTQPITNQGNMTNQTHPGQMPVPPGNQSQSFPHSLGGQHQMPYQMDGMTNNFNAMKFDQPKAVDLMNGNEHIVGPHKYEPKPITYQTLAPPGMSRIPPNRKNCDRDVMASTMNAIPSSDSICQKSKLPFGLILHPYKDLQTLPVITTSNIVRCRSCRSYINPFVSFIDVSRWKCNLCGRVNEVPEEFKSNPITQEYGKPEERPECLNSTVEFIAPVEYMSRPPQAAQYMFILDVSYNALQSGYLNIFAEELLNEYKSLPGDKRTSIGFICFNSSIHFFNLSTDQTQPAQITVSDIDDPFEPIPDGLMVNREECGSQIETFLKLLPTIFSNSTSTDSCGGSAITIGKKLMSKNGGRISIFSTTRVNIGPGRLEERKATNPDSNEMLNAKTDFYKTLAIEANQHHISIDIFLMGNQFQDIASITPISRNSAGSCYRYPGLHHESNSIECERFRHDLSRYFTRKIGFEAVMRVRATRGISIHTFYGNFFVRSTDLLNLACVSPDSGYAMRLQIDEDIRSFEFVGFQCALLYTSPKGDRRIRVHTMSLPVTSQIKEIHNNADAEMVAAILAHMAVDRSISHSLSDAREALTHATVDAIKSYRESLASYERQTSTAMLMPPNMKSFPLFISALLKSEAFRSQNTIDDNRSFMLQDIKQEPYRYSKQHWYPDLYQVDNIIEYATEKREDICVPIVNLLPLSCQYISREGIFLMDVGWTLLLYVSVHSSKTFLTDVLEFECFAAVTDGSVIEIPEECEGEELIEPEARKLFRNFVNSLQEDRPHAAPLQIIREDGKHKHKFISKCIQDRTQSQMSYYEFLTHLQKNMK